MTTYKLYENSAEIPFTVEHGHQAAPDINFEKVRNALTGNEDPNLIGEYVTIEAAMEALRQYKPVMYISGPMGHAVRYIRVEGAWVDEYEDDDYTGLVGCSRMPD